MKLFIRERGSEQLTSLLDPVDDRLKVVSAIAALEARSAIRRRQDSGESTFVDGESAIASIQRNLPRFTNEPLTPATLQLARELVDRRSLRALDSIQLATCQLAGLILSPGEPFLFISSDERLLRAAQAEGLETWNPASGT